MKWNKILCFLLLAVLCIPLWAQVPSGEKGLSEDQKMKEEDQAPIPPIKPAPTKKVNQIQKKELPASFSEEKSKKISRFFDEALKNYEDILKNRPEAEMRTSENRYAANIKLLKDQENKLKYTKTSLRKIKLAYIQQYLMLKNSFEKGKINKQTYEQELEALARRYEYQVKTLASDVEFWKKQKGNTRDKVKALHEMMRINKIMMAQRRKVQNIGKKNEPKRPLSLLEKDVKKLEDMGTFQATDMWEEPEIR